MIEDPMKKTACQAGHVTGADRKEGEVSGMESLLGSNLWTPAHFRARC